MLELLYHSSVLLLKCTVHGLAWTQLEEQSPNLYGGIYGEYLHKQHDTSVIWFGSEREQSKHQCPVHLQ